MDSFEKLKYKSAIPGSVCKSSNLTVVKETTTIEDNFQDIKMLRSICESHAHPYGSRNIRFPLRPKFGFRGVYGSEGATFVIIDNLCVNMLS